MIATRETVPTTVMAPRIVSILNILMTVKVILVALIFSLSVEASN